MPDRDPDPFWELVLIVGLGVLYVVIALAGAFALTEYG